MGAVKRIIENSPILKHQSKAWLSDYMQKPLKPIAFEFWDLSSGILRLNDRICSVMYAKKRLQKYCDTLFK